MKRITSLLALTCILTSCTSAVEKTETQDPPAIVCEKPIRGNMADSLVTPVTDTAHVAIIPYDPRVYSGTVKGTPAQLNTAELATTDSLFRQSVQDYNKTSKAQDRITNPDIYKRQYIAVLSEKGEKLVWVNCFCNAHGIDWRTHIIGVDDGGACYFQLTVNLSTQTYFSFSVNGKG